MIVKIDTKDNDYAEDILKILENNVDQLTVITDGYFHNELSKYSKKGDYDSLRAYQKISKIRDQIRWFLAGMDNDSNRKVTLTKKVIKDYIKKGVLYLLENSHLQMAENIDYLNDTIEISFPKSIKGEWENSEVIYYFPSTFSNNKFLLF